VGIKSPYVEGLRKHRAAGSFCPVLKILALQMEMANSAHSLILINIFLDFQDTIGLIK
jgi:hypothetical protein